MLSVKIFKVDYYISKRIKELDAGNCQGKHWSEPVIRIFGPASDGTKTCVNIHGVYPYIYVPYRGGSDPERDALLLGAALDQALAATSASKSPRFVHRVVLASGIPLYGYHSRHRQFFKIYFLNPCHIRKASDLLLRGAILAQRFQPHEAHIPFPLQFMIDYNLYGMSYVTLSKVRYRRSPFESGSPEGIDAESVLPAHVKRTTRSCREVDAAAEDILNKGSANPGLEAIWEEERARRRASQVAVTASRSRDEPGVTSNEEMHRERLARRLDEIPLSYPAEVPDDAAFDILSASFVGSVPAGEELAEEVTGLVDERILTQEGEEEPEQEEKEEEEEEEEEEPDDGGDMTQPLESDAGGADEEEEVLWRRMAERVLQLDGAVDSEEERILSMLNDGPAYWSPEPMWCDDVFDFPSTDETSSPAGAADADGKSLVDSLRNFTPADEALATRLKSYLNTCGDIVRVDVKNLSGKETVVIEYKSAKSSQSKFLIKPLDRFLEDWNGDAKASSRTDDDQVCAMLTTLENKYTGSWLDESRIQAIKNKFVVKSVEMLPEGGGGGGGGGGEESSKKAEENREETSESESECEEAPAGNGEAIKFVTRLLSALSSLPTMPPLSVTINFGGVRSPSVEFNLHRPKKKKLRVRGLDGAADTSSSSEDSTYRRKRKAESGSRRSDAEQATEELTQRRGEESDFIGDSDDERKRRWPAATTRRTRRKRRRRAVVVVPQTDVMSSSEDDDDDDDDLKRIDIALRRLKDSLREDITPFDLSGTMLFESDRKATTIAPERRPPTLAEVEATATEPQPFASDPADVFKPVQVADRVLRVENHTLAGLRTFVSAVPDVVGIEHRRSCAATPRYLLASTADVVITPLAKAPKRGETTLPEEEHVPREAEEEGEEEEAKRLVVLNSPGEDSEEEMNISRQTPTSDVLSRPTPSSGLRGASLEGDTYGFEGSLRPPREAATHEGLTMLLLEVHVETRGTFLPDPVHDPILSAFYAVVEGNACKLGVVAVGEAPATGGDAAVDAVADESALLDKLLEILRRCDPDILGGYEVETQSWGYLFERGFALERNLLQAAGRVLEDEGRARTSADEERALRVSGREVLDVWRLFRHEISLSSYTFENVVYHVLRERHPRHSFRSLSRFWQQPKLRHITAEYYLRRVDSVARLLSHADVVNRTSELARLFGIQFNEVLSRGSQFRVESMMLRVAKPLDYVACSPSTKQRAGMRAPASLPLIMEPESQFYADPVVVLDFQSLYPSVIIAYNYCFSTCLGRVELLGGREPFEFGCTYLQVPPEEAKRLREDVSISPAGVAFVKANIRKGILPAMLEEILETRIMVKKALKECKDAALRKVLDVRQLGLKLIANVTYGYTAANFSGRMPCIEVGDSVVSKGRETLQRAIELVKRTPRWGARVVYGDTDSLFVVTPGKSRAEAFAIGREIAEAVTRDNPRPVRLKLEKVYQPSILQTKKRYVGYMYESPEQETAVYDAKGIETVRRDGCPAAAKILRRALAILFDTRDVSRVKDFVVRQFDKIYQGRIDPRDLVFAREYRGRGGYRPGACVPALELARQWTRTDRRAEPRVKERVPYVVVNGAPGLPLIRLVRSPRAVVEERGLRINAAYYITKAIVPPLQRCFSLLGVDVMSWYADMPRRYRRLVKSGADAPAGRKRATLSQYFETVDCVACGRATAAPACGDCCRDPQRMAVVLYGKIRTLERRHDGVAKICSSCCGRSEPIECESFDCPILFKRHRTLRELEEASALRRLCSTYLA